MWWVLVPATPTSGQITARTGRYKPVFLVGLALVTAGMALLSTMTPQSGYYTALVNLVVVGLGLGLTMPIFTLVVQNAVPYNRLGVGTSVTQFFRSIGGTLGAAVFGSVMTNAFNQSLDVELPRWLPSNVLGSLGPERLAAFRNPQALLSPEFEGQLRQLFAGFGPDATRYLDAFQQALRESLAQALHGVFLGGAGLVAVALLAAFFIPEIPLRKSNRGAPQDQSADGAVAAVPPNAPREEVAARAE
jgi:MFS family permease